MKHWLETLWHRMNGRVAVTVTLIGRGDVPPESLWAVDVFSEDGNLCVDTPDGNTFRWALATVDFLVAG